MILRPSASRRGEGSGASGESAEGRFAEFDLHLSEGAVAAAAHVHPAQQKQFHVESGSIRLRAGDREQQLEAGEWATVDAGVTHAWGNTGSGEAHVVVRLTPALRSEDFFETFCGLARDGKVTRQGLPRNPFQLAVLARAHLSEFALASSGARALSRPLFSALAIARRAFGLKSRYPRYAN